MIKIIEGNIVNAKTDFIIHQVNCQGEMNTGVAKALRDYDEGIYKHYISYSVSFVTMSADRFGAISFDKGNVLFAKDLYQIICDIFDKYHLNRLCWSCIADNPAIRGYRNFIKEHGGRECAYHKQICKLMDGKLHDDVEFEILAEEFKR